MTEKLSAFDLETFISKLVDALPKFVGAAIIIALGFWVSALIGKLLIKGLERKGVDASIHSFLRSIVVWVLRFAVILSALSTLGFNLNSFIAALGAAGLTAGMGLQNISGRVHEIKLMYTVFITVDNKRVIVPNSHITSNNIINYNAEGRRRLDMTFSVSYSDDIALAKQVLLAQALKNELIYKNPEPNVVVKQQSASSMDLLLIAWCSSSDYLTAYYKMQEEVKLAFDENGINIPFNQLDVHISNS